MLSVSRIFFAIVLAAMGVSVQAQGNQTDTPFALQSPGQLVQCKNTTIVWQGGQSPYKVTLKPVCGSGQNASEETHSVTTPGSTSLELPIRFAKGTPLTVSITDSANMQATAPQTTVVSGDADDSCTTQTTCTDAAQAPNPPVAVADPSTQPASTSFPTDHLITADPSATPSQTQSMTDTYSSGSTMVIVYSYVSQTPTPSASAELSRESQPNSAFPTSTAPTFAMGLVMFVGANLAFGLW
ncbi:unnamed protein product [Rhizoctonia solani]|uniref:Uncharacterized protein n=1 Tax=Rhizoctonia solani TaxID=456999 RepID=A0A8H3DQ76_9AGAM|nr:unnamed protein product [Rhizoctonia solani]